MHDKMLDLVIKIEPTASGAGGLNVLQTMLLVIAVVIIFAAVIAFIMKRK